MSPWSLEPALDAPKAHAEAKRPPKLSDTAASSAAVAAPGAPVEDALFMEETIWDAGLLICLKKDGQSVLTWFQVIVVITLGTCNMIIQAALVSSIGYNLAGTPLTEEAKTAVLDQRLFHFQKYDTLDATDLETQTALLCKDRIFTQMSVLHADIRAYLDLDSSAGSFPVGALVAAGSMLLFTLSMIVEFYRIFDQAVHVYWLPSANLGGDNVAFDRQQNVNVICSLNWRKKVCVAVTVLLPRLTIAFMLLLLGLSFIATTLSVEDLILNAVALEVVKEVDEYMFRGLVTAKLRHLVTRTRFVKFNAGRERTDDRFRWKGASYKDMASTLARVGFVAWWLWVGYAFYLLPFLASVRDFHESLCGGSVDAVWRSHVVTPLPFFSEIGRGSNISKLEGFACVSAANGDMIRIRAGFEPARSAPNETLLEMVLGDSPDCEANGGSLRCPELSTVEIVGFDSLSKESYQHASSCKNLEVHMAMIVQTCSAPEHLTWVPFFEGKSSCADFAELCQCSAYDDSGFCAYTNFTALQEAFGIDELWVNVLQGVCPESCNACQRSSGRRLLAEAAGGVAAAPEEEEPRRALAVAQPEAAPRGTAAKLGTAADAVLVGSPGRVRHLEERVAALELRNAELERDDGGLLEGLEQRLALLEALTADLESAEDV